MAKRPLVSEAERAALEAGTVGFEGSILNGKPDWRALAAIPDGTLTAEEQAFLDGPVEELCNMIDDWEIFESEEQDMPKEAWDFAARHGFFGLVIPKEYGGKGFSALAHSAVVMKLASRSFSAAINVMVPNSLGPGELIAHNGTQEQKDTYLPLLASGKLIPCFGLTEPGAGSDAASMKSKGVIKRDEKGEPYIHIDNLDKRYITLAPVATLIGIAFQLEDPENILGKGENPGITFAIIPRETEGLQIGNRLRPMDLPFNNGTIRGDIKIPVSAVIGGEKGVGQGWSMLLSALSIGRSVSLPSVSTAAAKYAAYVAGAYVQAREQFGLPIQEFEGLDEPLSRVAGLAYLADATRILTARMVDAGELPMTPSAIAKAHLTEIMRQEINDAMDILAGKGVISGPGNPVNRLYQGVPVGITVEGANIMTRSLMIFGQGGMRAHKHMLALLDMLDKGLYGSLALRGTQMGLETVAASAASQFPAIMYGTGKADADPGNRAYYRNINRLSKAFQMASNVSYISQRQNLKRKERLSGRLGDVWSYLYMASAALQKFEHDGRPENDRPLLEWSVQYCLDKAETAFDRAIRNFPNKPLALWMRLSVFPFYRSLGYMFHGAHSWEPSDKLEHEVVQKLIHFDDVRQRLTAGIFKPTDPEKDTVAAFNDAFHKCREANMVKRMAKREKRSLTERELAVVEAADTARDKVINIDEYGPDAKTPYKLALEN